MVWSCPTASLQLGAAITMDVRCDRCQTEYELDDDIVTDAVASVQCTTCGHTFFVRRQGRITAASPGGAGRRTSEAAEPGLGGVGGRLDEPAPASPEWTLDTEDGKVHRFRELNTLQKWIVERRVTREDRVSHSGGPFRLLGELPELLPFFNVVEEADRARLQGSAGASGAPGVERSRAAAEPGRNHIGGGATSAGRPQAAATADAGMEPTISFSVPVAEAFRRASEDGPTVPDRRLFDPGTTENGLGAELSADVTAISAPPPGVAPAAPVPAPREVSGAGPMPPPVPADASRPHARGPSAGGSRARSPTPRPGALAPTQALPGSSRTVPGTGKRRAAITESVAFPNDALAGASDLELLRPSRGGGLAWAALVLVLAGAGGAYLWYRSAGGVGPGSSVSPSGGEPAPAESAGVRSPGPASAPAAVAANEPAPARAMETATVVPSSAPNAAPNPGSSAGSTGPPGQGASAPQGTGTGSGSTVDPPRGPVAGGGRPQARVAPPASTGAVVDTGEDHAAANPADRAGPGAAPAGDARPPSYEKLVVEGNRLRAHGNMARASKLYEQALAMRPDGVMALTGTGYVHLEHQRHFKAIDFFRRALAIDPTHGPALFGIAEAYRARGDTPEALAAYRQYLALAPTGDDVGEARRQIKALSSDDESP